MRGKEQDLTGNYEAAIFSYERAKVELNMLSHSGAKISDGVSQVRVS